MGIVARYVAALAIGAILFIVPFARYWGGAGHSHAGGPHSDHDARHGGHLLMLHDHHLELVDLDDSIELYLSDSRRRPMRPTACEVAFDGQSPVPCAWRGYRSVVEKPTGAQSGLYEVQVDGGPALALKFP